MIDCMNCKGTGCMDCQQDTVSPPLTDAERMLALEEAIASVDAAIACLDSLDDTVGTKAIVPFDPDLRPDQFDGVPADNR